VGAGSGARGVWRDLTRARPRRWPISSVPPASRQPAAAPARPLCRQALDEEAPGLAGAARLPSAGASAADGRAAGSSRTKRRRGATAFNAHIAELAPRWSLAWLVVALQVLRGYALINATTIVAEIGDVRRFANPRQLNGLCRPHGERAFERRAGAARAAHQGRHGRRRKALVEAAWTYTHPAKGAKTTAAQATPALRAIADKARHRLSARYRKLRARGKLAPVAVTAMARESLGFIWAIAQAAAPAPAPHGAPLRPAAASSRPGVSLAPCSPPSRPLARRLRRWLTAALNRGLRAARPKSQVGTKEWARQVEQRNNRKPSLGAGGRHTTACTSPVHQPGSGPHGHRNPRPSSGVASAPYSCSVRGSPAAKPLDLWYPTHASETHQPSQQARSQTRAPLHRSQPHARHTPREKNLHHHLAKVDIRG